ncbi:hypothetical protein CEXT_284451 [Caerostris extrusa]|uniref:Uncharacterized protein n=1 Tax=Caerostris extrusa TaxID=172846 RepID=A0AAV4Y6X8_CAEEX|nr:hypothetical protein CEXT_284451 [Caerostris extrusa]
MNCYRSNTLPGFKNKYYRSVPDSFRNPGKTSASTSAMFCLILEIDTTDRNPCLIKKKRNTTGSMNEEYSSYA